MNNRYIVFKILIVIYMFSVGIYLLDRGKEVSEDKEKNICYTLGSINLFLSLALFFVMNRDKMMKMYLILTFFYLIATTIVFAHSGGKYDKVYYSFMGINIGCIFLLAYTTGKEEIKDKILPSNFKFRDIYAYDSPVKSKYNTESYARNLKNKNTEYYYSSDEELP